MIPNPIRLEYSLAPSRDYRVQTKDEDSEPAFPLNIQIAS